MLAGLIFVINSFIVEYLFDRGNVTAGLSAMIGSIILGYPIVMTAVKDLRRGILGINELVAIAVLAAFAAGEPLDPGRHAGSFLFEAGGYQTAGIVAFFMLLGEIIETRTAAGARASIDRCSTGNVRSNSAAGSGAGWPANNSRKLVR